MDANENKKVEQQDTKKARREEALLKLKSNLKGGLRPGCWGALA